MIKEILTELNNRIEILNEKIQTLEDFYCKNLDVNRGIFYSAIKDESHKENLEAKVYDCVNLLIQDYRQHPSHRKRNEVI